MKKVSVLCFLVIAGLNLTAQKTPKAPVKATATPIKSLLDSFSYAAGINVARNMKDQGISELNTGLMAKAIEDVFKNKAAALKDDEIQKSLQRQLDVFAKTKQSAEKARGLVFLEGNKKNKDVIVLPDGLQYQVVKAGDPAANKPKAEDTVVVNYIGTLIDGKEFDNSYKRGQPAVFAVGRVIRGWAEILQLMPVGSHWKVFIPSELAYGEAGYGNGVVPPNAVLIFDIVLEGIKPAANPAKTE